jgi:ubiquinol-cytochrome c reductase iron-sulfur subunit
MRHDDYYLCYIFLIKYFNHINIIIMSENNKPRRDFIKLASMTLGGVGAASLAIPFISSMQPGKDALALASTEIDLTPIPEGESLTVVWRGKPVYIRHRSQEEIQIAQETKIEDLIDIEEDSVRVQNDKWLIVLGVCTHLGCVPLGQKTTDSKGDYGGWFCPCHGSHYDTSGRIRKGPAPKNLEVPPYVFLSENRIKIG